MKKILILGLSLGISLLIQSCKKADPAPDSTSTSNPQSTQTSDQNRITEASSHATDEANNAVSNESSLSGRTDETLALPCNVVVTTVAGDAFSRLLTFNGTSCDGKFNRTGTAKITLMPVTVGAKWKDQGSKLSITLTNLKVTQVSDGNFVILNGTQVVTNLSTTNWVSFILSGSPIVQKVYGNYSVTFSDNSVRNWQEAKKRTLYYYLASSTIKFILSGDTMLAATGSEKVSDWGVNRNNDNFTTTIPDPLVIEYCSSKYKYTAGTAKHYIPQGTVSVLFSSNSSGTAVNSCAATGYYLSWQATGSTSSGNFYSQY